MRALDADGWPLVGSPPVRAGQGSVACIDRTFQRALRRPLERGAVMMAHPLRALARTILALVALVPGALEGRMWVGIGPRAVTCLRDSDIGGSVRTVPRAIMAIALNISASEAALG
jgi:hypothetical protein